MKKQNWMTLTLIATLTLITSACGKGGQVQGHTYVATGAAGYQAGYSGYNSGYSGYNTGYNSGYNQGYTGYNTGYAQGGAGDSVAFSDNFRATYRQAATGQTLTATYSYLDNSNQTISLRMDAAAAGQVTTAVTSELRFTVSSDGSQLTNLTTGQVMIRQQ